MNKRQPPLKALWAFEAAGRHLSLSDAADELFVSPGAISQQIKLLEDFLSVRLFDRRHRQIALTEVGEDLLPAISSAFDQVNQAIKRVADFNEDKPLTVSAAPTFAARWLLPRLHRFHELHPDIDVRIDSSAELSDLAHSDIDVGIRFGSGHYPGLHIDFLSCQEVFPVCAPSMIHADKPLESPADLRHYQLLHDDNPGDGSNWPDWQMWLAAAGVRNIETRRGMRFREGTLLIDAALRGQGVALAGDIGVKDAIETGALIKPFELSIPQEFSFYLVCLESTVEQLRIKAFRQWILTELGENRKIC